MSKIKSSATKFEVEKFNDKGNFGLWQKRVKALLVQQGLHKTLKDSKICKHIRWGLGGDGSASGKRDL